ncbi:MAG TPA: BLUF domain-containing protein [Rubrobacter sp.]|nr:BLUF domain-containing protein [Rubrobacter sp.]
MFFLVYVSSAVRPFSRPELEDLLATSRDNNARAGVTGMLLYKDGNFMQVIEGEEEAVRALYDKIGNDPRHRGEITLRQDFTEGRQFPDWSMGFRDLQSPEARAIPGYSEFLNTPLTGQEFSGDPTRAQKLLLTFKKTM